jgi:hypothetical protein
MHSFTINAAISTVTERKEPKKLTSSIEPASYDKISRKTQREALKKKSRAEASRHSLSGFGRLLYQGLVFLGITISLATVSSTR